MATQNLNTVTEKEQEEKDTARFKELNVKPETERTDDEKKEFGEIKERYSGRAEKRIGQLSGEKKAALERALEAERLLAEEKERAKALEEKVDIDQPQVPIGNENETVEVAGKKWYSDGALSAQIRAGKITETAAIDYQKKRNDEELLIKVEDRLEKKKKVDDDKNARIADGMEVLKKYPQFSNKHVDHNPNDPLYKMTMDLYNEGLGTNPRGFSVALKRAKQILGIKDTQVDRSSDLGVEDIISGQPRTQKNEDKEVAFSDDEKDVAIRTYTRGDILNPKTGRPYTEVEAVAKAKEAKKARMK